jgi:F0F1-type ATP synthase membrane subunit c/vacuolar-type H+-ATPase subunit K
MLHNLTPRAAKRITKALNTGALVLGTATAALAQGGINAAKTGITNATRDLTGLFEPVTLLVYVIAAIMGLYGGFKVYSKMQSGDQDAQKSAISKRHPARLLLVRRWATTH